MLNFPLGQSSVLQILLWLVRVKRPWGGGVATQFLRLRCGLILKKLWEADCLGVCSYVSPTAAWSCCLKARLFICLCVRVFLFNVCLSSDQAPCLLNPLSVSFPLELPNPTQPKSSNMCFKCDPDLRNVWGEIRCQHHPYPIDTPTHSPIQACLTQDVICQEHT